MRCAISLGNSKLGRLTIDLRLGKGVSLYEPARLGNADAVTDDLERVVGRKPFTVPEVYARFYASE
jgi:hypothetical protein